MSSTGMAAFSSRTTRRIALRGEIDMANADQFDEQLARALAQPNADIVVDLRELTFMDCSALHHLVNRHRQAQRRGSSFVVTNTPKRIRRLFELTHTDYVLDGDASLRLLHA